MPESKTNPESQANPEALVAEAKAIREESSRQFATVVDLQEKLYAFQKNGVWQGSVLDKVIGDFSEVVVRAHLQNKDLHAYAAELEKQAEELTEKNERRSPDKPVRQTTRDHIKT